MTSVKICVICEKFLTFSNRNTSQKMKVILLILVIFLLFISTGYGQEKVYYNQTEVGALFGKGQELWNGEHDSRLDLSLITFHGAKITKHHAVGFSLGFDQYESISIIPFALGWRGFLGKENRPQLIGGFDFGGGSAILEKKENTEWYESWYEGGLMYSPSIGVKLPAKKGKTSLTLTLAYKSQKAGYFQGFFDQGLTPRPLSNSNLPPGYNSITETSYHFHSLVARIGLAF